MDVRIIIEIFRGILIAFTLLLLIVGMASRQVKAGFIFLFLFYLIYLIIS